MDNGDLKKAKETSWKHKKHLLLISTNNLQKPNFLCDPNRLQLISSFHDALQKLAIQRTAQMRTIFLQTRTKTKNNVA